MNFQYLEEGSTDSGELYVRGTDVDDFIRGIVAGTQGTEQRDVGSIYGKGQVLGRFLKQLIEQGGKA